MTTASTSSVVMASTGRSAMAPACARELRQFDALRLPGFQPGAWSAMYASAACAKVGTVRARLRPVTRWMPRWRLRTFSKAVSRASAKLTTGHGPRPKLRRLPSTVSRCTQVREFPATLKYSP